MGNLYSKLRVARNWCAAGIFLASMMIVPASFGQGMAALTGKVADTQGALIPSGVVTATQISTGTKSVVNSNTSGQYIFPSLPPANYSIAVSAPGFKTFGQTVISVESGADPVLVRSILESFSRGSSFRRGPGPGLQRASPTCAVDSKV